MPISRRDFLAGVAAATVAPMVPAATAIESSGIVFEEVFHPTITVGSPKKPFFHDLDINSSYYLNSSIQALNIP